MRTKKKAERSEVFVPSSSSSFSEEGSSEYLMLLSVFYGKESVMKVISLLSALLCCYSTY
jgi:hypothetical protein